MFLIPLSGFFHIWDAFTQVWRRLQWRFWHVSVSKDAKEISKLLSTIVHRCTVHKDALCIMMHCTLWCTIHYAQCVSVSLKMHKKLLSTMHSALRCTMHYALSTIMHYDALCTTYALCTMMHYEALYIMHCAQCVCQCLEICAEELEIAQPFSSRCQWRRWWGCWWWKRRW